MKFLLTFLVVLSSCFANAAHKEIEYSISGFGQIPDSVRVNYLEIPIDQDQCRIRTANSFDCFGSIKLNIVRPINHIEVSSAGLKTHDINLKAFAFCKDGYVELTPPFGLYAKRDFRENGLSLDGEINLSRCFDLD